MKKFFNLALASLATILFMQLMIPLQFTAHAQETQTQTGSTCDKSNSFLGLPTWYKYLPPPTVDDTGRCELTLPKNEDGKTDVQATATRILAAVFEILLRVAGLVAVVFVIIGGVRYVTSDGEPENASKALWTIVNAIIGLVIVIIASSVVVFIGNRLSGG